MFTGWEDLNIQTQLMINLMFKRQMNFVSDSCTRIWEHNFFSGFMIQKNLHFLWFIFSVGCFM